jgi:hypothetical protein
LPASLRKVFSSSAAQRTRLRRVVRGIASSDMNCFHENSERGSYSRIDLI